MDKQKLPLVCAGKLAYDAFHGTLKDFLNGKAQVNFLFELKIPTNTIF